MAGFDISLSGLLSAFVFGVMGMYIFRQGMKRAQYGLIFTGVGLLIAPYFTHGWFLDWGVGFALCGLAYYLW